MSSSSNNADSSGERIELPVRPPLFKTLADLIAPETIAALLHIPVKPWATHREPIASGYSGATIERVALLDDQGSNCAPTFILKHLDPSTNWLMRATGDALCRELQFTQSSFWTQLPANIWSPILGCSYEEDGTGTLLMSDVQPWIFSASICYTKPDPSLIKRILDRLAAMHAAYWNDSALRSTSWLTTPADAMLMLTSDRLSSLGSTVPLYFQETIEMWERLWSLIDPADAVALKRTLNHPADLLAAIDYAPATLAHGDAWPANFGECNDRLILLDWAFAAAGPATFDSLWLANTWRALDPNLILTQHRVALLSCGVTAVRDDATWNLLADLGWIRAVFMGVESLVRDVLDIGSAVPSTEALDRLRFWCSRAASILCQRGW